MWLFGHFGKKYQQHPAEDLRHTKAALQEKRPFIFNSDRTITWSHTFVISATFQSPCPQLCSALSSGCVHAINPSWWPPATPPEPTAPSIFLQPQTTVLLTDLTKITGREKYRNKGTSSEADHLLNMMEAMFEHSRDSGSIVLSEDVTAVGWIVKFTALKFSRMWLNWSQCFTVQMDNDLKHTPKLTKVFLKERNGIFFNSETSQLNKLCCY